MKFSKHIALGLTLAAVLTTYNAGSQIHAAQAASQNCVLKDGLQQLFAAHSEGDMKMELNARKGLLYIISDCTREETQEAISSLEAMDLSNDQALNIAKTQLLSNLKEEFGYIDTQKNRIADVGVSGTRDLAETVKVWRSGTHLPELANTNNFSLWEKNQSLIEVANNRSKQINQTLKTLKLTDRDEIKADVGDAQSKLDEAKRLNQNAHDSLSRLENPETTARTLRNSFSALSSTYTSFFKISEEVKKILPL